VLVYGLGEKTLGEITRAALAHGIAGRATILEDYRSADILSSISSRNPL
jgi:hypothetical protein